MSQPASKRPSDTIVAALVIIAGVTLGTVATAVPRPVAPTALPLFEVDLAQAEQAVRSDTALARSAPRGDLATRLQTLYEQQGQAEVVGDDETAAQSREASLRTLVAELRASGGDRAVAALRAHAMSELEPALAGRLAPAKRDSVLGSFPRMLERYGLARAGRVVAPAFVVRTLFKARWNAVHRLAPTDGFARVELRAYHGWLALRAESAPIAARIEAATAYGNAGGERADEARGVLLFRAGRAEEAADAFVKAFGESGSWRLRNHGLAATARAD